MRKLDIRKIAYLSLLIALQIILSRFLSITTPISKIGFSFVPLALCGMLYGPLTAGVVAAISDFLGAILFPSGAFFPGFTLTAFLTGVVFGCFLYKEKSGKWLNIIMSVFINCIILGLLMNTFWISILYTTNYFSLFMTRVLQYMVLIPVQVCVLRIVSSRQMWSLFYFRLQSPRP